MGERGILHCLRVMFDLRPCLGGDPVQVLSVALRFTRLRVGQRLVLLLGGMREI